MTEPFGARLRRAMDERGPLCVGIDPHASLLADWGLNDDIAGLERFSRTVVEALADRVAVLKPQSAFFERFVPLPIRYAGKADGLHQRRVGLIPRSSGWPVPHRTQFNNSFYAESNCGPTSLGMILEAYGLKEYKTDALRDEVNRIQGNTSPYEGTGLPARSRRLGSARGWCRSDSTRVPVATLVGRWRMCAGMSLQGAR